MIRKYKYLIAVLAGILVLIGLTFHFGQIQNSQVSYTPEITANVDAPAQEVTPKEEENEDKDDESKSILSHNIIFEILYHLSDLIDLPTE